MRTFVRAALSRRTHTRVTVITGVACGFIGVAVIIGWHLGVASLVQIRTAYRPMPYASAVEFLLVGVALVALARERAGRAQVAATAVLAVTIASVAGAFGAQNPTIHPLLHLSAFDVRTGIIGRMPPQAAVSFALIAAVVLVQTSQKPRCSIVALAGAVVGAIGVTGVFGYATHLPGAYAWPGLPPMAFHGAVAFTVLGLWALHAAWTAEAATAGAPQSIAVPIGVAAATISLVLWQALLDIGHSTPANAVLITGLTVASALGVSVRLAQTARRELRRAQATARRLTSEIVERHRIEQALRDSEEKLAKAFAINPAAVTLTRLADGRFVDVNETWQSMVGHRREDVIGRSSMDLHIWPTADARRLMTDRLCQEGSFHGVEQTLVRKSGDTFVALISAATLTVAGEELALWTLLDITGRKRHEEALRESEAQLSAFFNSPGAMRGIIEVVADDDVRFTVVNAVAASFFGFTPTSMRGKRGTELGGIARELLRECVAACRRSQTAQTPESFEYVDYPGGRARWLAIEVGYVDRTEEGDARFAFIASDVTARKEAEERLHSLQATTAALSAALTPRQVGEVVLTEARRAMGATVAAVGLIAPDTQDLDVWNSEALRLHGEARWRRCPLTDRIMLADVARSGKSLAASSSADYAEAYPDGVAEFSALGLEAIAAAPLKIDDRVLGALAFSFAGPRAFSADDLAFVETLAAQTAQALERARLFQEAERRAAALRDANERLADADRKKDEFLATLAHELRNPLAPVRFALALIEAPSVTAATARRGIEVMSRQITHLVRLIDDLLDVSRITRNKIQLRKERVTVSTVVRTIVETAEPQMSAAGHHFSVSVRPDAAIDADPTRIVQVVTNLLNNAAKFTPPGGEITLETGVEDGHAVIQVRDSGIGIAHEALPRVFDMFHQVDSSVDRSAGGLGIGLALAKRLVELHGGTIEAASEGRNRGATFTVRLPLADAVDRPGQRPQIPEAADAPTRQLSILIVDDNADSAEMLAVLVGDAGHRTRMVHDGSAAIVAAAEFTPDVVLLDIGLPGISGYDVARELRRQQGDAVHLVAITGWGQPEDRRRARDAGFDCHMTKPADADQILAYLDAVAHRRQCTGCAKCLTTPLTRAFDRAQPVGWGSGDEARPTP